MSVFGRVIPLTGCQVNRSTNMNLQVSNRFISLLVAAVGALSLACEARAQSNFTTLHSFTALQSPAINGDGQYPVAELLVMGGALYGTASRGGVVGSGTLFSMNPDGTGFTNLHNFGGITDGGAPTAGLVCAANVLYGALDFGGPAFKGGVFAINNDGSGFRYLHTFARGDFNAFGFFTNRDGAGPEGGLVLSGNVLYGTTVTGGPFGAGALFAVNTDGTGFTNLHFFDALANRGPAINRDGGRLSAELVLGGDVLFGATEIGGEAGVGTIFSIHIDGTGFQKL